jgi:hypothetical protein
VALAFVGIARRSLGPNGSLAAAMIWLTNFGLLEKGRMIEIEALYVSLTALAFICWLSWRLESKRRWLAWTVPWVFLGLALLAKGPLVLLFFYAVVLAVPWQTRELRELWRWPHLAGLILMLAIFGAWAFPYLQMTEAGHVAGVWSKQFSGRVTGADFKFADWLLNIPRGIAYLLPWVALLPFARFALLENEKERKLCRALSLGVAVPFVVVNLMPGALPRYTMPLLAPAIWLLAILIRSHALLSPASPPRGSFIRSRLSRSCNAARKFAPSPRNSTPPSRPTSCFTRSIPIISHSFFTSSGPLSTWTRSATCREARTTFWSSRRTKRKRPIPRFGYRNGRSRSCGLRIIAGGALSFCECKRIQRYRIDKRAGLNSLAC